METRREFHAKLLGSAIAFGLIETLWSRDLFAEDAKPTVGKWFAELAEMTKDLKGQKLTDLQFQTKMEDLYKRVPLADLCAAIKLDEVEKRKLPDNGAANVGFDLSKQAPAVVFGLILIAMMFLAPAGIAGLLRRIVRLLTNRFPRRRMAPSGQPA